MKILTNNYNNGINNVNEKNQIKTYPRNLICDNCGSELEYEKTDLHMGALGCMHVECPLCGYDNVLDDNEENIFVKADNIEFPTHFFHISKKISAVDVCDNEHIREYVKEAIDFFRKNKEEFVWYVETGNLAIIVFRYDGDEDYRVIVSNDYYHTYIDFEDVDY